MIPNNIKSTAMLIFPFLLWGRRIDGKTLYADLVAGLTGAVIVLPQGVAYAYIAGLPPEFGLYTAIVTPVVAALFGSSLHLISGPTAAISIVVMSVASGIGDIDPSQYVSVVLSITLFAGVIQFAFGVLNLGVLINFISHTVVIGFTAGAAILIATSQFEHFFGLSFVSLISYSSVIDFVVINTKATNVYSLFVGVITLVSALAVRKINRSLPHLLIGMLIGSLGCLALDGANNGVALVGALPGTLPPFSIPNFSADTLQSLASGAFAVAILGLIEAVSIARSIAIRSHQQINGNQEFIGQGLSNIIGSFFSCYAGSGSFTRSGANYDAGAKTPMAAIFAAIILAAVLVIFPGVTAYLPLPAMAGAILLICWNLIDFHHIAQIMKSNRSEASVFSVTFLSTLFVDLEFAIYIGVFISIAFYLRRTSRPTVMEVAPITNRHDRIIKSVSRYDLSQCPQLKIVRIDGSLFFGAVGHIQDRFRKVTDQIAGVRFLLVVGKGINFVDVAGAEMLMQESVRLKSSGVELIFCSFKGTVLDELDRIGYLRKLGKERFYDSPEEALGTSIGLLEKNSCQDCLFRIFRECQ